MASLESSGTVDWQQSDYLKKIADTLGCAVNEFGASKPLSHSGQIELIRLWSLLPDDAARRHFLAVARTLAEQREPA